MGYNLGNPFKSGRPDHLKSRTCKVFLQVLFLLVEAYEEQIEMQQDPLCPSFSPSQVISDQLFLQMIFIYLSFNALF